MKIISGLAILLAVSGAASAQQPSYGCDTPESKQLDFWVGDWDLTYLDPKGNPVRSRNRVTKILDGCVIYEEFSGPPGSPLLGRSLSTFDRPNKQWKQTWVDNTATYLDFNGGIVDGRMMFWREVQRDGRRFKQRMLFDKVTPDGMKWLWQRSDDDGKAWTTLWQIDYRRVKS
jgi:hypothetical protein